MTVTPSETEKLLPAMTGMLARDQRERGLGILAAAVVTTALASPTLHRRATAA